MSNAKSLVILVIFLSSCMTVKNKVVNTELPAPISLISDVYLPPNYNPHHIGEYPVVYFINEAPLKVENKRKLKNKLDKMIASQVIEAVVVAFVSQEAVDISDREKLEHLFEYVGSTYAVSRSRDRRYLIGGHQSILRALQVPSLFKAVAMHEFSGTCDAQRWNERSLTDMVDIYAKQGYRLPVYIIAGEEQCIHESTLASGTIQTNSTIQLSIDLYQKLHKLNLFGLSFEKGSTVPASPAELRIIDGMDSDSAWLAGAEESLKYLLGANESQLVSPTYDASRYDSTQTGKVFRRELKAGSNANQQKLRYNVYLPFSYDPSDKTRYPVLYLLHGSGGTEESWDMFWPILDKIIETKIIPPLIAVAPVSGNSYWVNSQRYGAVESDIIQHLIPEVERDYHTIDDRSGRGLIGFSMGGYGVLRYSLVYPQLFSTAVLLSPAIQRDDAPATSGAVSRGAFGEPFNSRVWHNFNYPVAFQSYCRQIYRVPMFIIAGDDDWNHVSEKSDLPDNAYRYNMEKQVANLYSLLHQPVSDKKYIPLSRAELRIVNGGHDIDVWASGFEQGLRYMFANGMSVPNGNLQGGLSR
ncbi:alpha/beta hydrolase-fold protein [Neptunicella sp. SCSIO 80796]|uniref:alpha/beta hydrolase-fold protein n=1 Tax=Neptunicella plasticusilytica TaxID=3117012 RepID=UPI003A4DDB85